MSFSVKVQPSGRTFQVETDETILEAALRQNVGLPYGCKNGACGSCKSKVLEGTVEHASYQSTALSDAELRNGYSLFCRAKPCHDLVVEARVLTGLGDIPIRKMPCRVQSIEKIIADVAIVKLQLAANERLQYRAGQYIELILKDGKRRSYSMATAPQTEGLVELHIRHMPGGVFTDAVFGVNATPLKERDILRFEGPLGTFFLREDSDKPIILLASGTGFAPIKAIIEHAQHVAQQSAPTTGNAGKAAPRPMTLYWGARSKQDLYLHALAEQWAQTLPWFNYVPVLSEALPSDAWQGRTGLVHQAVMQDYPDLSTHQIYACGAPIMVDSARRDFSTQCGLPSEEFYADAFTSAADGA